MDYHISYIHSICYYIGNIPENSEHLRSWERLAIGITCNQRMLSVICSPSGCKWPKKWPLWPNSISTTSRSLAFLFFLSRFCVFFSVLVGVFSLVCFLRFYYHVCVVSRCFSVLFPICSTVFIVFHLCYVTCLCFLCFLLSLHMRMCMCLIPLPFVHLRPGIEVELEWKEDR